MAKDKKEAVKKEAPKKVSKQELKRQAAQREAINNQKKLARDNSLGMLDNLVSQVALDREGHQKVVQAVRTLQASNLELEAYEKAAAAPKEVEEENSGQE